MQQSFSHEQSINQSINTPTLSGKQLFIHALTTTCHLSLSVARQSQSKPSHPIYLRSILTLSSHLWLVLPSGLVLSCLPISSLPQLFMPTHSVSELHNNSDSHLPPSLSLPPSPPLSLSPGIINVSSVDIQILHCTDTHIRHAAVFEPWHMKVNLEDSGDAVMSLQAVQEGL